MRILSLYIAILTLIASGQTAASEYSLAYCVVNPRLCYEHEYDRSPITTCPGGHIPTPRPLPNAGPEILQPKAMLSEPKKNQLRVYTEVLAGKACELFLAHEHGFDKAKAKALGKICKYVQAKKPAWEVATVAWTTFGACKIAEKLLAQQISLPITVGIFVGVKSAEYFSHPRVLESLEPGSVSESRQFIDYWALRPMLKTVVTGVRYAEERLIQECYKGTLTPAITAALSAMMPGSTATILGNGIAIGISKAVSGVIAETIVSSAKMHIEGDFSFEKLFVDVATSAALSLVMGIAIPTSLVVLTPKVIVVIFVAYTAIRIGDAILS